MHSQESQQNFYDPKTLAVMDRAFAAIWIVVKADDAFRNYAHDRELRLVIGKKLLNLVADGVIDPIRLRQLTVESLCLPRWSKWGSLLSSDTTKGSPVAVYRINQCYRRASELAARSPRAGAADEVCRMARRRDRNQLLLVY
jgi:hypothetical protein